MSSEPAEVQQAVQTVSQALAPSKPSKTVTWITDRGFDDVAVWRTMWEQDEHVVCRVYHFERTVALERSPGQWMQGNLAGAQEQVKGLARVQTRSGACSEENSSVPSGNQWKWKSQPVRFV
jgi:hypothetical protein